MIYQTYHEESQRAKCFMDGPYEPIDLTKLGFSEKVQTQLCEYAAMWHLYAHPELNPDPWIGFTSHCQLTKNSYRFYDTGTVWDMLGTSPIVSWGWTRFRSMAEEPVTIMDEAELCHRGITGVMMELMYRGGHVLPQHYVCESEGPFCNYFACRNEDFHHYMEWSLPMVEYCLMPGSFDEYMGTSPRALSYICERLLICWMAISKMQVTPFGPTRDVWVRNRFKP